MLLPVKLLHTAAALAAFVVLGVRPVTAHPERPKAGPPATLQLPDGFQPEGITAGRGKTLYVASFNDGAVYAADARTGMGAVLVPPQPGRQGVGIKFDARTSYLFVAGGNTGHAQVHDARTGATLADFTLTTSSPTFINDVVITKDAVYFTDSFQPALYRLPLRKGGRLPSGNPIHTITLAGDYEHIPDQFNANGIEALDDGRKLLVINSYTGKLYKVDPTDGLARTVDLGPDTLVNGDGLVLLGRTLYVVENFSNQVAVVQLSRHFDCGEIVQFITDSRFDIPATAVHLDHALYVTNARFSTPHTPTTPYTVVRVPIGKE